MKKTLLLVAVALFVSSTAFSQFKFGAGVTAGTKAGIKYDTKEEMKIGFGLNLKGVYNLSDDFALGFGASYFLPTKYTVDDVETKMKNNLVFNVDAMYYLMNEDDTKIYGLGGLNWNTYKKMMGTTEASHDKFGWEVGGGVEFGKFFVEAKYDGNKLTEQVVATVGYYF